MGKTITYIDKNMDLARLAERIHVFLQETGHEVAYSKDETGQATWFFIQARKISAMRTLAGMRRSMDISIKGKPNHFDIKLSTGEWGKNLISSAPLMVPALITGLGTKDTNQTASLITMGVGVASLFAKMYTAKRAENNTWKYIKDQVKTLTNSHKKEPVVEPMSPIDSMEYDCDYIEGYPGWNNPVHGGKLILEIYRDNPNRLIFSSGQNSKKITIPANLIEEANLLEKGSGHRKNDKMIQLKCKKQKSSNTLYMVFNIGDNIILEAISGISEIVSDDKIVNSINSSNAALKNKKYCPNCGNQITTNAKFCSNCGTQLL